MRALTAECFDLLVSLYSRPLSGHCTPYLRVGGMLLANASHGDVALALVDPRYELAGVALGRGGVYRVSQDDLGSHLVPKRPTEVIRELIERTGRGIADAAHAYLFHCTR